MKPKHRLCGCRTDYKKFKKTLIDIYFLVIVFLLYFQFQYFIEQRNTATMDDFYVLTLVVSFEFILLFILICRSAASLC